MGKPSPVFVVSEQADTEALLAQICESMTSANALVGVAAGMEGAPRKILIAIQQIIMRGVMARSRMLDNFKQDTGDELTSSAAAGGCRRLGERVNRLITTVLLHRL